MADDPLLTVRLGGKKARRNPVRIVLDGGLQIPPASRLVRSAPDSPVLVVCRHDASGQKERSLVGAGVQVLRAPSADRGVDLAWLLKELGRRRICSILVEGGGRVLGSFLEGGLADEFYFFYAPKVLGDPGGVRMLSGLPRLKIADCVQGYGIAVRRFAGDLLVSGKFREQLF
jgi:diaminohydroxyphosphoribosylaminopyrimidine deaminase/5-amino-6-(5-phosphoribosylamino)uracil reductase